MSGENRNNVPNFSNVASTKPTTVCQEKNDANYQYDSEPDALHIVSREGSPVSVSSKQETRQAKKTKTPPPSLERPEDLQSVRRVPSHRHTVPPPTLEPAIPQSRSAALSQSLVVAPVAIAPAPLQPVPTSGITRPPAPTAAFPFRSFAGTSTQTVTTPNGLGPLLGPFERQGQRCTPSTQSNINNGFCRTANDVSSQMDARVQQHHAVVLGQNLRAYSYVPQKNLSNPLYDHSRMVSASRSNQAQHAVGNVVVPQRYPSASSVNAARSMQQQQQFAFQGVRKTYPTLPNQLQPMVSGNGMAQLPVVMQNPMVLRISEPPLVNFQVPSTSQMVAAVNQPMDTAVGFCTGSSISIGGVRPSNVGTSGGVQPKSISIAKRSAAQFNKANALAAAAAATAETEELNHKLPKSQYNGSSAERQLRPLMPKERSLPTPKSRVLLALTIPDTNNQNFRFASGGPPYINNHANMVPCVPVSSVGDICRAVTRKEVGLYENLVKEFDSIKNGESFKFSVKNNIVDSHVIQETLFPTPVEVSQEFPYQNETYDSMFRSFLAKLSETCGECTGEDTVESSSISSKRGRDESAVAKTEEAPPTLRSPHSDVASTTSRSTELPRLSAPSKRVLREEDVYRWSAMEVVQWLHKLDSAFDMYHQSFLDNSIDGTAVLLLREEHLLNSMQIRLGHAVKIAAAIERLRRKCDKSLMPA